MQIKKPILYLLLLHNIWISQKFLTLIFKNNENYEDFYNKISYRLLETYGIRKKQIEFILKQKNNLDLSFIIENLEKRDVNIITIKDDNYPKELRNISNPPYLLYIRWNLDFWPKLAVVGARKITSYGEKIIENIIPELSKYFTIVSGWAAWCDTKAHKETIISKGKTISVIWTGINIDYPVPNKKIYDNIVTSWGVIISIFPFLEPWNPYNFPIRNEIVAWLSVWTIIIEAKEKSWSLITWKLALDLWRDLFAVPWDIFRQTSIWCNNLIWNWEAKLVQCYKDILSEYNISFNKNKSTKKHKIIFNDNIEKIIYEALTLESYTIDELSKKINIDTQTISFKLSMMEITGLLKKIVWWKYEIK